MKNQILIVEDDIVFCKMLNRYLEKNGFRVSDSQTAARAIDQLSDKEFDLAILDYQLPDQNGIEVLKWINTHKPNTSVIMLTRFEGEEVVQEALTLGAASYVLKPIKPEDLLAKIKDVLAQQA